MNRHLPPLRDQRKLALRPTAQFSFRTLIRVMGVFAFGWLFLQELFERFGLLAALVAVLAGLSIFAHVAGAFVGSRYRKIGIETPNPEISED